MGLGGINLPTIIASAASAAVTQVYAAAAASAAVDSPSVSVTAPLVRVLSPLKLLHLRFIYGAATDYEIPRIWLEVFRAPTKSVALVVLSQYLWAGR